MLVLELTLDLDRTVCQSNTRLIVRREWTSDLQNKSSTLSEPEWHYIDMWRLLKPVRLNLFWKALVNFGITLSKALLKVYKWYGPYLSFLLFILQLVNIFPCARDPAQKSLYICRMEDLYIYRTLYLCLPSSTLNCVRAFYKFPAINIFTNSRQARGPVDSHRLLPCLEC